MNKRIVPENAQRPSPFGVCAQMAADDKWEDVRNSCFNDDIDGIPFYDSKLKCTHVKAYARPTFCLVCIYGNMK